MTYQNFFEKWSSQLEKLKNLLDYIHEDKALLETLELSDLITSNELESTHKEFLSLYTKYTGLEKDFFQEHWISIRKENLGTYVDISDELFPVFSQGSLLDEPYSYYKVEHYQSMFFLPKIRSMNVDLVKLNEYVKNKMMRQHIENYRI